MKYQSKAPVGSKEHEGALGSNIYTANVGLVNDVCFEVFGVLVFSFYITFTLQILVFTLSSNFFSISRDNIS